MVDFFSLKQLESEKLENGTFPRNLTYNQMAHFESVLDRYFEERLEASKPKWTVVNSVFFASTVVTTIGELLVIFFY